MGLIFNVSGDNGTGGGRVSRENLLGHSHSEMGEGEGKEMVLGAISLVPIFLCMALMSDFFPFTPKVHNMFSTFVT